MKALLAMFLCVLIVDQSLCIERRTVRMPPEVTSQLIGTVQRCMMETRTGIDTILLIYQGGYTEDKKFKDFLFCCYKGTGFLKPDGHINTEKTIRLFKSDPEVVEGLRRCSEETGKNSKEALFKFYKCFQDTVPVKFAI